MRGGETLVGLRLMRAIQRRKLCLAPGPLDRPRRPVPDERRPWGARLFRCDGRRPGAAAPRLRLHARTGLYARRVTGIPIRS